MFKCCYCDKKIKEYDFAIGRDGIGEGPRLPLCNECGFTLTDEKIREKLKRKEIIISESNEHTQCPERNE